MLIVEDDDDVRELLVGILVARGYRAIAARNGQHAFDVVRRFTIRPAVILLDLTMPVMDGAQFLAVRQSEPLLERATVVLMTAQPERAVALPEEPFAVLTKPVSADVVLDHVRRACDESVVAKRP